MHEATALNAPGSTGCGCQPKPDGSCGCATGAQPAVAAPSTRTVAAAPLAVQQASSPAPAVSFAPYQNIAAMRPVQFSAAAVPAARNVSVASPVASRVLKLPDNAIPGSFSYVAGQTAGGLGAAKFQIVSAPLGPIPGAATLAAQRTGPAPAIQSSASGFSTAPRLTPTRPPASPTPTSLSAALQNARARPAGAAPSSRPTPDLASSPPAASAAPGGCCIPGNQYNCCCTDDPSTILNGGGTPGAPAAPGGAAAGSPAAKAGAGKAAYDRDFGLWQAGYTHFPPDPNDPKYGGAAAPPAAGSGVEPAGAPSSIPRSPGSQRLVDPWNPEREGWWFPGFANSGDVDGGPIDLRGARVGQWSRTGMFIGIGGPPSGPGTPSSADGSDWIAEQF